MARLTFFLSKFGVCIIQVCLLYSNFHGIIRQASLLVLFMVIAFVDVHLPTGFGLMVMC